MAKKLIFLFYLLYYTASLLNAQTLIKYPYLAEPTAHSVVIRWESDVKEDFELVYGITSLKRSIPAVLIGSGKDGYFYQAKADQLNTGKTYSYQVRSPNFASEIFSFKGGVKRNRPFSFVVLGDSRSKPKIFNAIIEQIKKMKPDLIIGNGDLVAKGGNTAHWQKQFFDPAKDLLGRIPFLTSVGDHESDEVDGDEAKLFTRYLFPRKDHLKLWYSYDLGDAHFIFLDWRYPDSEEMINWFQEDVKNSDKQWKFVVMHRPVYNLGGHHLAWGNEVWPVLFRENKIDIVFAGHSHLYERFYPMSPAVEPGLWPVTYITTGGAGASLYESITNKAMAYTRSVNHFLKINIDKNKLVLKAFDVEGNVLDSVSWSKKKGKIDKGYLKSLKPQEEMDIINIFNGPISKRMERLPMVEIPYQPVLKLKSGNIKEDIVYTIRLALVSKGNYEMEPVKGILKAGEEQKVKLNIFGRTTLSVSKWGMLNPELRLITEYKTKTYQGKVIGKKLEYIAW